MCCYHQDQVVVSAAVVVEMMACQGEDESYHGCLSLVVLLEQTWVLVYQGDPSVPSDVAVAAVVSVVERIDLDLCSDSDRVSLAVLGTEAVDLLIEFLVVVDVAEVDLPAAAAVAAFGQTEELQTSQIPWAEVACQEYREACSDCQEVTWSPCWADQWVQETLAGDQVVLLLVYFFLLNSCWTVLTQEAADLAVVSWSWEACWSTVDQDLLLAFHILEDILLLLMMVVCSLLLDQGNLVSCVVSQGSWDAFLHQDSSVECSVDQRMGACQLQDTLLCSWVLLLLSVHNQEDILAYPGLASYHDHTCLVHLASSDLLQPSSAGVAAVVVVATETCCQGSLLVDQDIHHHCGDPDLPSCHRSLVDDLLQGGNQEVLHQVRDHSQEDTVLAEEHRVCSCSRCIHQDQPASSVVQDSRGDVGDGSYHCRGVVAAAVDVAVVQCHHHHPSSPSYSVHQTVVAVAVDLRCCLSSGLSLIQSCRDLRDQPDHLGLHQTGL